MRTRPLGKFPGFFGGLLALGLVTRSEAADTVAEPVPGVCYVHRHVSAPREIDMHIAIIDLNQPGVRIKTTGGNGDRPGEDRDPRVLNRPSDGRERAVGNNLAVIVNFAGRAAVPQSLSPTKLPGNIIDLR